MLSETNKSPPSLKVYESINAVAAALGKIGISKDRQGTGQFNYKFRGIDDVYAALSPLLAEHKICILPNVIERSCTTYTSSKGNNLFSVSVKARFDIVSFVDGSSHSVMTMGEAMDSGDKATNKAMSAAYKYAAFMTFCIPTEGDNDTENVTHEVSAPQDKSPPNLQHKELMDRAKAFASQIDGSKSDLDLADLVAKETKLQTELKAVLPDWSDRLMVKITDKQNAFRSAVQS